MKRYWVINIKAPEYVIEFIEEVLGYESMS